MISALQTVRGHLPLSVQVGVDVAATSDDLRDNEIARVALWQSIEGRDHSDNPEVLCTRLAIGVLHPASVAADTQTSLEYFVDTFRKANLPESALAEVAALESYYHEA